MAAPSPAVACNSNPTGPTGFAPGMHRALPAPRSSWIASGMSGTSVATASAARAQVRQTLPPTHAPRRAVPAVRVLLLRVAPPALIRR